MIAGVNLRHDVMTCLFTPVCAAPKICNITVCRWYMYCVILGHGSIITVIRHTDMFAWKQRLFREHCLAQN